MKRPIQIAAALLVIAMSPGCSFLATTSMSKIKSIPIPDGLTNNEAISGVVLSTDPSKMPVKWAQQEKIIETVVENQREKTRTIYNGAPNNGATKYTSGTWRVEEVDEENASFAVLGYSTDTNYVRVKYSIVGKLLVPEVMDSENMRQHWGRIHTRGITWINQNIPIIREGMWQVKKVKMAAAKDGGAAKETRTKEVADGIKKNEAAAKPSTAS